MILFFHSTQREYVGNLIWKEPHPAISRKITSKIGGFAAGVAFNVHRCFNGMNITKQIAVSENIGGGLAVKEDPRVGDQAFTRKLQAPVVNRIEIEYEAISITAKVPILLFVLTSSPSFSYSKPPST